MGRSDLVGFRDVRVVLLGVVCGRGSIKDGKCSPALSNFGLTMVSE